MTNGAPGALPVAGRSVSMIGTGRTSSGVVESVAFSSDGAPGDLDTALEFESVVVLHGID